MYNWTCPYCDRAQTVGRERLHNTISLLHVGETSDGKIALTGRHISCANPLCNKTTVTVALRPAKPNAARELVPDHNTAPITERQLLPEGTAKPQPAYVPKALVDDYVEACLIRVLSPKASATLIRRCLQGMIRDFAGIHENTLFREIDSLRRAVDEGTAPQGVTDETVEAIDHVRKVGNIGAHMEADINHIVEVDPKEAEALISLVEMLFDEWYIARHRRKERLALIEGIAAQKGLDKKNSKKEQ